MKVKDLIKELNKMPKNMIVYWADHDHGTYETNNEVGRCEFIDKNEMTKFNNDEIHGDNECYKNTPRKYICLRPK